MAWEVTKFFFQFLFTIFLTCNDGWTCFRVEAENAETWKIYGLKIYGIIVILVNLYPIILFYDDIIDTKLVIGGSWCQIIFWDIHTRICWL